MEITQELAGFETLCGTTKSEDLFAAVERVLENNDLNWKKMVGITTDGAPAMIGRKAGLTTLISQKVGQCGGKVAKYHCILHQEELCAKTIGLGDVVRSAIKIINCIRSKALSHRQFRALLEEVDARDSDVLYHQEVRRLSRGKVLKRFFELCHAIAEFLRNKGSDTQASPDDKWFCDVAFMVDITDLLNILNIQLQRKEQIVTKLFDHIKAFKIKLKLLCGHLLTVLFLGVSHNLPLNLDLKLTAGAAFTGVCAVSGACSSFIRCSLLLTFPMMLGSRGRAYIVLLLISVLYTGPVQNIQRNLEDAALSLSCNLDLQLNHSRLLWRRAVVPFISMAQELTESTMNFGDETVNVSRRFATFQQEVMSQHGSVSLAADANDTQQQFTKRTMMQCDGVVQEAILRCSGWFRQKWTQCMSLIQVPVLNHLLCFPMKFSFLCDILRVMTSWCKDRIPLEGNLGQLWDQLNQSLNQFSSEFRAHLVLQEQQDQSALDGSLLDQDFTESVRDSFVRLTSVSEVLLELLQTAKSFTFITIIIQAVSYLVKYKKDVRFDNVYITSYFRRIDARRKSEGKRCVLPLTNTDRSRFIQPCSLRIHPQEAPQLFSGLVQLASVSLLVLVLVSVDLALFRVLDIVSRNTVTHFNITGGHQVDLRVGGASMMARLLQKTISAFNSSSDFDIDSSNKICECRPRPLSVSVYFSCVGCVLLVALFSLLQVYSSRIRRVLTAAYHPEREKRRVLFLYNLLLQKHTSSADRKSITRHYCDSVCFSRCCASSCRQNKDQSDSEEVHYDAG